MKQIKANNYSVYIGNSDVFTVLEKLIAEQYTNQKKFVLVDENTIEKCLPLIDNVSDCMNSVEIIQIDSGEEHKNIATCQNLWETLLEVGADRHSLLINLGGGVITDMGGFVASTFKRGIGFVNIPTTLLSQVDASVGGKTGVDLGVLKNQIGVFSNPQAVLINEDFLITLDQRQIRSGFAEIIKHSLIADANYWEQIKKVKLNSETAWANLIEPSINIKNTIVLRDEFENNERKKLNFGHTIGHAFESYLLNTDNLLLHGEAIAIGMICESYLSHKINNLPETDLHSITQFIISIFSKVVIGNVNTNELLILMRNDKKNRGNEINFSLLSNIGTCLVDKTASENQILEAIHYYQKL